MHPCLRLAAAAVCLVGVAAAADPAADSTAGPDADSSAFRVRPYLQNPAPDAMTIRWLSPDGTPGRVLCADAEYRSTPVACPELDYQPAEPADRRHAAPPFLHAVRITGLEPATSYPYVVEQAGETVRAVLTTSPRPGDVGRGGGVRLFFYADSETQPESRGSRVDWPPSTVLSAGPRPGWVGERYLADETTGYRMNLALIASRAAESLRAGNPVLVSVVGDLVESGGEQRDWDEFWRHNAGGLGTLASRAPLVAAPGNHELLGGPRSADPRRDLGGYSAAAAFIAARKFRTYFELPDNGADDERHRGRYFRLDFGPVTLLSLDSTNGGSDDGPDDTNHALDRRDAPQVPDYLPGSPQYAWLERELALAQARGAVVLVQFHHMPFSSGPHGRPPGEGEGQDEHSGRPLRALGELLARRGVRAVFCGHDEMYEHCFADGVHYYDVGIGGDGLRGPVAGLPNDRQIFSAHDHAPEVWRGDVLVSGGRQYGHVEVDVTRSATPGGYRVTITPAHVFPVLDPDLPGTVAGWERREYDDVLVFEVGAGPHDGGATRIDGPTGPVAGAPIAEESRP